jgi:hypothetical protein
MKLVTSFIGGRRKKELFLFSSFCFFLFCTQIFSVMSSGSTRSMSSSSVLHVFPSRNRSLSRLHECYMQTGRSRVCVSRGGVLFRNERGREERAKYKEQGCRKKELAKPLPNDKPTRSVHPRKHIDAGNLSSRR